MKPHRQVRKLGKIYQRKKAPAPIGAEQTSGETPIPRHKKSKWLQICCNPLVFGYFYYLYAVLIFDLLYGSGSCEQLLVEFIQYGMV